MAHFNVWDFISVPLLYTTRSHPDPTNHAEAVEDLHAMLPVWIQEYVTQPLSIKLAKVALLTHRPSMNTATNALLLTTIPSTESIESELRYLAAFKR